MYTMKEINAKIKELVLERDAAIKALYSTDWPSGTLVHKIKKAIEDYYDPLIDNYSDRLDMAMHYAELMVVKKIDAQPPTREG